MKIPISEILYYSHPEIWNQKVEIEDLSFPVQDAFVKDPSKFIVAQCSRRAGKTNGLVLRFFRTLETHPGALCLYIALTRDSAKRIIWPILKEMNDKFGVGCHFTEFDLAMKHPNGSFLQLFGADMKNFINRLRGVKSPGVAIDEAQGFGSHLQNLVDDVVTPALADYKDSWLALAGSPGPVPLGYYYEISHQKKYGFSYHAWTVLENPYLPHAENLIEELKLKNGWDDQNPTLLREWKNEWVLDRDSLLIQYQEERNHYENLPTYSQVWIYLLGIDIGFKDSDALAVLAWNPSSLDIYLVCEKISSNRDISSLIESIHELSKLYSFSKMVIDTGGLGKKIAEEIIRRHHIPVQAADKSRKMENVALLNDYLRLGRFKAKKNSQFVADSYRLQIDWEKTRPDKIIVRDTFHSDIIDAVLYAFRESPAYTYQVPARIPKPGDSDYGKYEEERMEQAAVEYFEREMDLSQILEEEM